MRFDEVERRLADARRPELPGPDAQSSMAPRPRRFWVPGVVPDGARRAAGLALLFPRGDDTALLLTVRGSHLRQSPRPGLAPRRRRRGGREHRACGAARGGRRGRARPRARRDPARPDARFTFPSAATSSIRSWRRPPRPRRAAGGDRGRPDRRGRAVAARRSAAGLTVEQRRARGRRRLRCRTSISRARSSGARPRWSSRSCSRCSACPSIRGTPQRASL